MTIKELVVFFVTFALYVKCHNLSPDGEQMINEKAFIKSDANQIDVWPYPQQVTTSGSVYSIDPYKIQIITKTVGQCELLDTAIVRYKLITFIEDCSWLSKSDAKTPSLEPNSKLSDATGELTNFTITVTGECETIPHMFMNEEYTLKIDNNGGQLTAKSVWGAIRGLETFSQLVKYAGNRMFTINGINIVDFPRFSHRGIMLDTSRHYVPVHVLYENLDAMAYNKFNVFHWHIVDDQSFPYVSKQFPNLSLKGAYNPQTHIYTSKDVSNVIEYARERGIRVLVEFDTPGHTQAWGKGQPGLLTPCYKGEHPDGTYGPIDPINDANYEFIKTLFKEVTETFPDQYFHVGGDEVDFSCWMTNPDINKWMKQKKIAGDYPKLEEYYIQNVLEIVKSLNRSYIIWQEVFDNGVVIKPDTVVHVWKDHWQSEMYNVTKAGYHSLLSTCWYLNYISYGTDWPTYYQCDPQEFNGTDAQNKLVQGGEACMWGEWVDGTNLISRTWPRANAVAERLWSSKDTKDVDAANGRFNTHHCRMLQRGLRVQPANGPGFCQCDYAV